MFTLYTIMMFLSSSFSYIVFAWKFPADIIAASSLREGAIVEFISDFTEKPQFLFDS